MKKTFTLLFILISIGFIKAQSLELRDLSGTIVNNQTVNVSGDVWDNLEGDVHVKNISASTKYIKCKRSVVSVPASGTSNYFCWYLCYGPGTNVSPTADTVDANESVTKFHGYFVPNGQTCTATIKYTFYDMNNTSDSAQFTMVFTAAPSTAGINGINKANNSVSEIFPNPSNGNAALKFTNVNLLSGKKVSLKVYNLLGKEIATQTLNNLSETITLNYADLNSGIYFVTVYADNKSIATKRFVIE